MKHLLIPLIALLLIVGVGVFESICLYSTFKKFEAEVDEMLALCHDQTLTVNHYREFNQKWQKIRKKSEFFLPHNDVYEITLRVSEIKAYVEQGDFDLCNAHLCVIKELASYVSHIAVPSLGHVF